MSEQKIDTLYVHAGRFHADDVMCAAVMETVFPGIKVIRTNEPPEGDIPGVAVADIGGGKYDHHQSDPPLRKDGHPHAAIGLIMEDFGRGLFPTKKTYENFYEDVIAPMEDADTGAGPQNIFSGFLDSFNPVWDSEESADERFGEAVKAAKAFLDNKLDDVWARNRAHDYVMSAYEASDGDVVYLEKSCPCQSFLQNTDALFYVFPGDRGVMLQAVNKGRTDRTPRQPILGKAEDYEGCTFVHNAGFIASFESAEAAVRAGEALSDIYKGICEEPVCGPFTVPYGTSLSDARLLRCGIDATGFSKEQKEAALKGLSRFPKGLPEDVLRKAGASLSKEDSAEDISRKLEYSLWKAKRDISVSERNMEVTDIEEKEEEQTL